MKPLFKYFGVYLISWRDSIFCNLHWLSNLLALLKIIISIDSANKAKNTEKIIIDIFVIIKNNILDSQ